MLRPNFIMASSKIRQPTNVFSKSVVPDDALRRTRDLRQEDLSFHEQVPAIQRAQRALRRNVSTTLELPNRKSGSIIAASV